MSKQKSLHHVTQTLGYGFKRGRLEGTGRSGGDGGRGKGLAGTWSQCLINDKFDVLALNKITI